jgi:hypothetical protein
MIAASGGENLVVVVLLAVLPIMGALFGGALGRWADARNRRRDQYADAIRVLVRWAEYPYRIRRRSSNDRDELRMLIDMGHDLQEQLQCHRTWIGAECLWLGDEYGDAVARIKSGAREAIADAWRADPVSTRGDLVLDGWGPSPIEDDLDRLNRAISCRFGLRRTISWIPPCRRVLRPAQRA